jgi:hypothetical protein
MTEAEWLTSENSRSMLDHLLDIPVSDRKLRLFAVACCRQMWALFDERSRNAVEVVERHVDGMASAEELAHASLATFRAYEEELIGTASVATGPTGTTAYFLTRTIPIIGSDGRQLPFDSTRKAIIGVIKSVRQSHVEAGLVAALFRDTIGNPFRPVTVDPSWRTSTVLAIAKATYHEGAFDHLPILADCLEDAGCTDAAILKHLRGPGPHVRGCWCIDLLLNKK